MPLTPASPLPWKFGPAYGEDRNAVLDAQGRHVCDNEPYYPEQVAVDDMRYIAHSANLFPELLSALKVLVGYLRESERWPVKSEHIAYLSTAEQAIQKADSPVQQAEGASQHE